MSAVSAGRLECVCGWVGDARSRAETNILLSFTGHSFETDIKSTIGVDLKLKILKLRNKTIKLTLWDTAGPF